jgi:hypothetical protein
MTRSALVHKVCRSLLSNHNLPNVDTVVFDYADAPAIPAVRDEIEVFWHCIIPKMSVSVP